MFEKLKTDRFTFLPKRPASVESTGQDYIAQDSFEIREYLATFATQNHLQPSNRFICYDAEHQQVCTIDLFNDIKLMQTVQSVINGLYRTDLTNDTTIYDAQFDIVRRLLNHYITVNVPKKGLS